MDWGNLQLDRGAYVEAEEAFQQAVEATTAVGADGLSRLCGESRLVCVYFLQDRVSEAAELAETMLHRSQSRDASPLELAIAQTTLALARIHASDLLESASLPQLLEAHRTLERLEIRYGVFASGALISLAYTKEDDDEAREYLAEALGLAAAESYIQPLVTWRPITLPLLRLALHEGIELRFVSSVLTRMGEG